MKTLGNACQIKPPKSEAREMLAPTDMVSFLPMNNLGIDTKLINLDEDRSLEKVAGSYTYFAENDVLLAKITPCFENGKLGIARGLTNGIGFGSSEYVVFRPNIELTPEYLYYFLSQDGFRAAGARVMSGAVGHKRVPKEFIDACLIPLPPPPEQKRIVAILDEAFEGIAIAVANAEKNLANAGELFDSHLNTVFSQKGDGWVDRKLGDMLTIKHGFAFKSTYFCDSGKYVLLTPGNFYEQGGYRDKGNKQKFYCGDIPEGFILSEGDLLMAMTEQAAGLLGSSIIVPEGDRFLHNQRLGLAIPQSDVPWCPQFFSHAFNTPRFRKAVHEGASGVKVRHTSPKKLGSIVVAYPDTMAAQISVATNLDDALLETQRVESIYQQRLSSLAELKQSILQKAFAGELTSKPDKTLAKAGL